MPDSDVATTRTFGSGSSNWDRINDGILGGTPDDTNGIYVIDGDEWRGGFVNPSFVGTCLEIKVHVRAKERSGGFADFSIHLYSDGATVDEWDFFTPTASYATYTLTPSPPIAKTAAQLTNLEVKVRGEGASFDAQISEVEVELVLTSSSSSSFSSCSSSFSSSSFSSSSSCSSSSSSFSSSSSSFSSSSSSSSSFSSCSSSFSSSSFSSSSSFCSSSSSSTEFGEDLAWGDTKDRSDQSTVNYTRAMGGTFADIPAGFKAVLKSVQVFVHDTHDSQVRMAVYQGGSVNSPAGSTLVWDAGQTSGSQLHQWIGIDHPGPYPELQPDTLTWIVIKGQGGFRITWSEEQTDSDFVLGDDKGRWNSTPFNDDPTVAYPSTWPADGGNFSSSYLSFHLEYEVVVDSSSSSSSSSSSCDSAFSSSSSSSSCDSAFSSSSSSSCSSSSSSKSSTFQSQFLVPDGDVTLAMATQGSGTGGWDRLNDGILSGTPDDSTNLYGLDGDSWRGTFTNPSFVGLSSEIKVHVRARDFSFGPTDFEIIIYDNGTFIDDASFSTGSSYATFTWSDFLQRTAAQLSGLEVEIRCLSGSFDSQISEVEIEIVVGSSSSSSSSSSPSSSSSSTST